jgi:hypothetical protein
MLARDPPQGYLSGVSVVDDSGLSVATGDAEPWAAALRELTADEAAMPPEPGRRNRAIAAILLIVGLIAVGILLILVGSALGSDSVGGCGGG